MKFDLAALQAKDLPRITHTDIGFNIEITAANPVNRKQAEIARTAKFEIIDKYLKNFVFLDGGMCPGCGNPLGGPGGKFGWADEKQGAGTGEGGCTECGYPARAHHNIDEVIQINHFVLAYHPSCLSINP